MDKKKSALIFALLIVCMIVLANKLFGYLRTNIQWPLNLFEVNIYSIHFDFVPDIAAMIYAIIHMLYVYDQPRSVILNNLKHI